VSALCTTQRLFRPSQPVPLRGGDGQSGSASQNRKTTLGNKRNHHLPAHNQQQDHQHDGHHYCHHDETPVARERTPRRRRARVRALPASPRVSTTQSAKRPLEFCDVDERQWHPRAPPRMGGLLENAFCRGCGRGARPRPRDLAAASQAWQALAHARAPRRGRPDLDCGVIPAGAMHCVVFGSGQRGQSGGMGEG